MRFPNAYSGVKKIYTSEILMIVSAVLVLIMTVLASFGTAMSEKGGNEDAAGYSFLGAGILLAAVAIIDVVAFIMQIVGVTKAAKDEPKFNMALIWIIIDLVASVALEFVSEEGTLHLIASIAQTGASIFITYHIIRAINSLAEKLGSQKEINRGNRVITLFAIAYVISFALNLVGDNMTGEAVTVGGVLAIIAMILIVVAYFTFLKYLSRARGMLLKK